MLDPRFVAACAVALTVTLIAIFSLRPMALRLGLVDRPNERKLHRGRVPLIGGLCFFLGTVAGLSYLELLDTFVTALLVGGSLIMLTGLLDDLYELSVRSRLAIQTGVAALVIAMTGVHIDTMGQLGASELRIYAVIGVPLTLFAVVGLVNAFNMLDGIDGLAGGLAAVSILTIMAFAVGTGWQALGVLLLLQILLMAIIPYLSVNMGWPDGRKIFMGDAGSTVIGFLLAWSVIFLSQRSVAVLSPVDVLWCIALPVMDTLAVVVRRVRQGQSPFKPDRQHLHHLVTATGFTSRAALALIIGAGSALALFGYALRNTPDWLNLAVFIGVMTLYVAYLQDALQWLGNLVRKPVVAAEAVAGAFASHNVLTFESSGVSLPNGHAHGPLVRALCVLGESDDAIRIGPIARQLCHDARFDTRICITDHHSDNQRQLLELFDLHPDVDLDIGQLSNGDPTEITSATLSGMKRVLRELHPDVVLVHGDTSTTLAATLAACYQQIPVARLESMGEPSMQAASATLVNRRIASALASLHFTPDQAAVRELLAAGIPADRITMTSDTAVTTLRAAIDHIATDPKLQHALAERFSFLRQGSPLLLVTHREHITGFAQLGRALRKVARQRPDVDIVYPIELTPDARRSAQMLGWRPSNVHLVEPLDFFAFAFLLKSAYLVLTGSSEVRQEAALLGKPVLVLHEGGRSDGANGMTPSIAIDERAIADGVMTLLDDRAAYDAMRLAGEYGGDQDACLPIIEALAAVPSRSPALAA